MEILKVSRVLNVEFVRVASATQSALLAQPSGSGAMQINIVIHLYRLISPSFQHQY